MIELSAIIGKYNGGANYTIFVRLTSENLVAFPGFSDIIKLSKERKTRLMKVKFTKKSIQKINKWLQKNDFAVKCARIDEEEDDNNLTFIIDFDDNMYILTPRWYDEEPDGLFMRCLRDLGLNSDFDSLTLSILHELGHAQTCHLFTKKEWEACDKEKEDINEQTGEETFFNYWKVKNEKAANMWLVMFAECFPKKVQELEDIIGETVKFG